MAFRARMKQAVRRQGRPARWRRPEQAGPGPGLLALLGELGLGQLQLLVDQVVVRSESCLSSSPRDWSCRSSVSPGTWRTSRPPMVERGQRLALHRVRVVGADPGRARRRGGGRCVGHLGGVGVPAEPVSKVLVVEVPVS